MWDAKDLNVPLIKTIGRSYNPVWYSQSLAEIVFELSEAPKQLQFLSACGAENKVISYKIDLGKKELVAV